MENPYQSPQDLPDKLAEPPFSSAGLSIAGFCLFSLSFLHLCLYIAPLVLSLIYNQGSGIGYDSIVALMLPFIHGFFLAMICIGTFRMTFHRSYAPARMAAEMGCIPLLTPFGILGMPFAFLCLQILKQPHAKEHFADADNEADGE